MVAAGSHLIHISAGSIPEFKHSHQFKNGTYKVSRLQIHLCLIIFLQSQQRNTTYVWMDVSLMYRNRPPQHYTALNRCKQETSRESVLRELVSHFYLPSFICLLCKALWTRYSVSDEYKGRLHGIHYFLWEGSYWN